MFKRRTPVFFLMMLFVLTTIVGVGIVRPQAARAAPNADFIVTDAGDSGSGTLREAIAGATSGDRIIFTNGLSSITLLTQLVIDKDIIIDGGGAVTISGGGVTRVFLVTVGNVTFDSLTIANGNAQGIDYCVDGSCGGGIMILGNATVVTVNNSTITNNMAVWGGGIRNGNRLGTAANTSDSAGTLTITNSTISNNTADYGGGGIGNAGALTVSDSTFSGNIAYGTHPDYPLPVGNAGTGGAFQSQDSATANSIFTNVTFSGNQANGWYDDGGGAITIYEGDVTLVSVTMVGNSTATNGGAIALPQWAADGTTLSSKNSIVANNTAVASGNNCSNLSTKDGVDITSTGYNLDGDGSCGFSATGDTVNANPLVGTLANNGGATETHALLSGSPAIDAGDNVSCESSDQRGIVRPQDGDNNGTALCDIGAYEVENTCTTPIVVSNNSNSGAGSLRQAIANVCFGGLITFDGDYSIPLSSYLDISKSVTIDGEANAVTINGGGNVRVFNVQSTVAAPIIDVTFDNLTIANGRANTTGCRGSMFLICGGGIMIEDSGVTATVSNSTLFDNSGGNDGGGIYNYQGILMVTNSTLSDNSAQTSGGGINNYEGTVTVSTSTISGNGADSGAGISSYQGTLTVDNSTISGNGGGGIRSSQGVLTVRNSTIADNFFDLGSGGIDNSGGTFHLYNTILADTRGGTVDCASTVALSTDVHNLIEGNDGTNPCGTPVSTADPVLGSLQDNGGSTETHALLPGSPAIDTGNDVSCLPTDQRSTTRPQDGNNDGTSICDIGAYEVGSTQCTVADNGTYIFTGQSGVRFDVTTAGDIECLYVEEVSGNHPFATGVTNGFHLLTGKYWRLEALTASGATATSFNLDLTLPYVGADGNTRACKWLDGAGVGYGWNCSDVTMPTAHPVNGVTRQNVTALSEWAVGNNVGPTAVSLQSISATSNTPLLPVAVVTLLLMVMGGIALRRYSRQD